MTPHATLFSAITASHPRPCGGHRTAWTRAEVLACLDSWAQEAGRPPSTEELGPRACLPGYGTIKAVCGSVEAVYAELGWAYRVFRKEARGGRPPGQYAPRAVPNRQCLCCDGWFVSEEPCCIRICDRCKEGEDWQDTGDWLAGVLVPEARGEVLEWWIVTT